MVLHDILKTGVLARGRDGCDLARKRAPYNDMIDMIALPKPSFLTNAQHLVLLP